MQDIENIEILECGCCKERIAKGLGSIAKEELEKIIKEDGKAETICSACNKKYKFSKEELEEILKKKMIRK